MNARRYERLLAEKTTVEGILREIPTSKVIDRHGFESRLTEINEELQAWKASPRPPARAKLAFRGKPVVGSHGVFARFGAKAVEAFESLAAAFAAGQEGPLGARGRLPRSEQNRLLIVGTAVGSFGFELEEATPEAPELFPSPVAEALEKVVRLLRATTESDDRLADELAEVDPRAVEYVRAFLNYLDKEGAFCSLRTGGEEFAFRDVEQVRRAASRLAADSLHETEESLHGVFDGVLPHRRRFEFRRSDDTSILEGPISGDVENVAEINRLVGVAVEARFAVTRIGQGAPRYRLLGYRRLDENEPAGA